MSLIEDFYYTISNLENDPTNVNIVYTNTNIEHTLLYKYYTIPYNRDYSYHENRIIINHTQSLVYKVPHVMYNDICITLYITCSGNKCLCKELLKLYKSYPRVNLVIDYYINCYNKYKTLYDKNSSLTIKNIEILNDYIKLRHKDIHIISCSFDPNFLLVSRRVATLRFESCNIKFLLWCYVNLRLGNFPNLGHVKWNQQESFCEINSNSIAIDKQIVIYLGKK